MTKHYVFTDFETTGLDANQDVLLEGAIVLVDVEDREVVGTFTSLIHEEGHDYLDAVNRVLFGEDQYVNKMHAASGLWDEWNDESVPSLSRAGWTAAGLNFLNEHGVEMGSAPMAGNSIGSLDRPFALRQLKDFSDFLHYRNLDISALRMFIADNEPTIQQEWEARVESDLVTTQHRALDDAMLSFEQWKFYSEAIFG